MSSRVEYHNTVRVIVDFVFNDPSESRFNAKDAFTAAFADLVAEDGSIAAHVTPESNVGLIIHFDLVLLYMGVGGLYKQDALSIVLHNFVVLDHNRGEVRGLNASTFILSNSQVLLYPGVVVLSSAQNAIAFVLCDGVEPDDGVTPEIVLGLGVNAVLIISKELIHSNKGLRRDSLDSGLAPTHFIANDFAVIASSNLNARALDVFNRHSLNLLPSSFSLAVDSNYFTVLHESVLDNDLVIGLGDRVDAASVEVPKHTV